MKLPVEPYTAKLKVLTLTRPRPRAVAPAKRQRERVSRIRRFWGSINFSGHLFQPG